MPISKKIEEQIKKLNVSNEEKELMLSILKEEDKGTHNYKQLYEKIVNEFIQEKEVKKDDINK